MFADCAIIDNITAIFAAEPNQLPLNAISLAVNADHEEKRAFRHMAALIIGMFRAGGQFLPRPAITTGFISLAEGIIPKGFLASRIAFGL